MNAPDANARQRLPFLNGVYVATDAIAGAYLIIDGPYCSSNKAEMQYSHNLRSRLLLPFGHNRVVHTGEIELREEVQNLSTDRTRHVDSVFSKVCALPDAEIVFATSFDFHELTAFPLREIARRHEGTSRALVCNIPSLSLGGTWLDGYAQACLALAQKVRLRPGRGAPDAVAVVGHLQDRDEPDNAGNLRELRRLLGALGLRAVSVWLSGGGRSELEAAERAGLVLSLPYAREAARVVAKRLKAPLCEVDLPLGLAATERFLRRIGARLGRGARAKRFAAEKSAAAVRDTQAHVMRLIAGGAADIRQDDPQLGARLRELCVELGLADAGVPGACREGRLLCFAPTSGGPKPAGVHVPIGYPNYLEHPVVEQPILGYAGFRHLVDRIAAAVLRSEIPRG